MAVEARHLNLFPSHLLCSREMLNSFENASNPTAAIVVGGGYGVSPAMESALPYNVLQHMTKTMNNQMLNPPLKDDSGLTFNTNVPPPFPRKRPREHTDKLSVTAGADSYSFLGDELSLQMMLQQSETNRLISLHMDKVKSELESRRRDQSRSLIGAIDTAIKQKLREKDEQINQIRNLNLALEERVKSLCIDNQIWRDMAQTNESTVTALRSNLELLLSQINNNNNNNNSDDAESCCGSSGEGDEIPRWKKVAKTSSGGGVRMCRRCGGMESSVLVLPCRHLCLCRDCGPTVDTCPVCNSTKNATLHVNFS